MEDNQIHIEKDRLYKLIREMKELRKLIPTTESKYLLKRHRLKIEVSLLERIFDKEGIVPILNSLENNKIIFRTEQVVVDSEK